MPLDAICMTALSRELSAALSGAKVEKIQQPTKGEAVFSLRGERPLRLYFGAGGGAAKMYLSAAEPAAAPEPPMFCMLLRKHLVGARVRAVTQPEGERILRFEFDAPGLFGAGERPGLTAELMGRYANLILTDGEGVILDCLRRVGGADERRMVLPGLRYRLPPSPEKLRLSDGEAIAAAFAAAPEGAELAKWLTSGVAGLSPLTARELAWRACGDAGVLCGAAKSAAGRLAEELSKLAALVSAGAFEPWLILTPEGEPFDFSYMPILQYGPGYGLARRESFSALLEEFYRRRDDEDRARQRTADLRRVVKAKRERTARRVEAQKQELAGTAGRDRLRECGDLIMSNLYSMRKGQTELRAQDYYAPEGGERVIRLDPLKTPQQNAAKYYKDYNRAKSAETHLTEQLEKGGEELDYLDSVLEELDRAETPRDAAAVRRELEEAGYLREAKGRRGKTPQEPFLRFRSTSGTEFRAGKNNAQNDQLTLRQSRKTDVWLHVQKLHGSHVVVSCEGGEPDARTLAEAASVAAYCSDGRNAGKVPVDYTLVKNVKKPSGAMPGRVIYTDYKTIFAAPDAALAEKLRLR